MNLKAWVIASRPRTLTAAIVPVAVAIGTASAAIRGIDREVDWKLAALILASALFIQIATNFFNDVIDFKKGADSSTRTGPLRAINSGLLTSEVLMKGAFLCIVLAFLFGIPLVLAGGWPIVAIGLVSLFLAYGYTGGPFPLAYLGLGDLFVIFFFGLIAVGGSHWILVNDISSIALIAGLQVGLLAAVLIAINNLRDASEDRKAGKRTLAVRIGPRWTKMQISICVYAPFVLGSFHMLEGLEWAAYLPMIAIPLASRVVRGVWLTEIGPQLNRVLALSAGLHLVFGLALAVGLRLGEVPFSLQGLGLD